MVTTLKRSERVSAESVPVSENMSVGRSGVIVWVWNWEGENRAMSIPEFI